MSTAKKTARKKKSTGRPVGRPTKRNPQVEKTILTAIRAGAPWCVAAAAAGVVQDTVRNWQRADPDFSVACAKAEAEAQISFIAQLAKQSNEGSTQATIHWLKCRCPSMREPKDQPVAIASSGEGLQGMLSMMTELARKVAAGEVAPSMLADMATVVEKASAVFERTDLETRIAALEAKR